MDFFLIFEECSDECRKSIERWSPFDRDTLGKQLMRAVESIGFNLVEADGRFTANDGLNRLIIARGSAREARLGIEKARRRGIMDLDVSERLVSQMTSGLKQLNRFIGCRRQSVSRYEIREELDDTYVNRFES